MHRPFPFKWDQFRWGLWLFVVVWAVTATLIFPSVVHRLADGEGFWSGGFVQGTGGLLVLLRLAQSVFETALLAACYAFLEFPVLLAVLMFLVRVALLLTGKARPRDVFSFPPGRSLTDWMVIASFVILSAAVFPRLTHWILWSHYAFVRTVGLALLSILGPAWILILLWLVYRPVDESDTGKLHPQSTRLSALSRFRLTSRHAGKSR